MIVAVDDEVGTEFCPGYFTVKSHVVPYVNAHSHPMGPGATNDGFDRFGKQRMVVLLGDPETATQIMGSDQNSVQTIHHQYFVQSVERRSTFYIDDQDIVGIGFV